MAQNATILIVPGLRDQVAQHWQTLLETELRTLGRPVRSLPAMGRTSLNCDGHVAAITAAIVAVQGPVILVAHSGGCIMVAHWAKHSEAIHHSAVHGALLAAPPDFDRPLPEGYPTLAQLRQGGWLPVPHERLPFSSLVAASRNDPLGQYVSVAAMAADWGSALVDLGAVGHLNPASGFGPWPQALSLITRLQLAPRTHPEH